MSTIEGSHNLRDLGGKPTTDGRRVRMGRVYRSGNFHALTAEGSRALLDLGLALILDFRSQPERELFPTAPAVAERIPHWYLDDGPKLGGFGPLLELCVSAPGQLPERMREAYRTMPYVHVGAYRVLFRSILDGKLPLAFHCVAGKDRTGAAAALLLGVLGVERAAIVEDFLLTNRCVDANLALLFRYPGCERAREAPLESLLPVVGADRSYIEALLEEIERRHGGFAGYASESLGLSDAESARLRELMLE